MCERSTPTPVTIGEISSVFFNHYYLIKTSKSSDNVFRTEEEEKEKDDNKNSYAENWIIIEWNLLMHSLERTTPSK